MFFSQLMVQKLPAIPSARASSTCTRTCGDPLTWVCISIVPGEQLFLFYFLEFSSRYVYFPIKEMRNTESQKFLAGVATFAFVALFHGKTMIYLIIIEEDLSSVSAGITQTNVLVWVFLNWFGILIETFALQIYRKRLSSMSGQFCIHIIKYIFH